MIPGQTTYLNSEIDDNRELSTSGQTQSSWFSDVTHPLKFDKMTQNISVNVAGSGSYVPLVCR